MPHIRIINVDKEMFEKIVPVLAREVQTSLEVNPDLLNFYYDEAKMYNEQGIIKHRCLVEVTWMPRPYQAQVQINEIITNILKEQGLSEVIISFINLDNAHYYHNR